MKLVDKMPETGSFVAIWEYGKNVWCDTYNWEHGILQYYSDQEDNFVDIFGGVARTAWGHNPEIMKTTKFYVGGE